MLHKLGLGIAYFIATVYVLSIVLPWLYCFQHAWCKGPGEGDAFMPAFFLAPLGTIVTAFSLHNAIQHLRKRQSWFWVFWPPAIIFGIVLLGTLAFIAFLIYQMAVHR